ncbi:hypothetical protein FN924_13875 [Radiobacillus deserti]|uniref:Voltage-dependent anion channel n=2 Tax=Radiobacillus deserti TaxID=2594883 RepID=A0A516KIG6_9BACI|nr:hypothetical protein FN924_13875 [Radiobacillus deserti]
MAAVMAIGIITQGVVTNYFGSEYISGFGKLLSIFNISLWIAFLFSLILSIQSNQFRSIHYENPINRFGIGTWIAATSICSILIYRNFPGWISLVTYITIINSILWITYMVISIFALRDICRLKFTNKVHGILLLTTVSTQSLVLLLNTIYKGDMILYISISLVLTGIGFYFVCVAFILKRYLQNFKNINIEEEWKNTNCILHGAVSITGLACIFTNVVQESIITLIWVVSATIFLIVELVEIFRLIKRVKRFGLSKGIFIYDVTQWSRLFTFGMFYTFTFRSYFGTGLLSQIQSFVIQIGVWLILSLIIFEFILSIKGIVMNHKLSHVRLRG